MKIKNVSSLLMLAGISGISVNLYYAIEFSGDNLRLLFLFLSSFFSIAFISLSIKIKNLQNDPNKYSQLFNITTYLMIASICELFSRFYYIYLTIVFFTTNGITDISNLIENIVTYLLYLQLPLAVLLLSAKFRQIKPEDNIFVYLYKYSLYLTIASIGTILASLYWLLDLGLGLGWIRACIHLIGLVLPVTLLIISTSLLQTKNQESNEMVHNLTVKNWLFIYLVMIIPIIGIVYLIIWANDNNNKLRKNWAIASLILMGIIFILMIFIYAKMLKYLLSF